MRRRDGGLLTFSSGLDRVNSSDSSFCVEEGKGREGGGEGGRVGVHFLCAGCLALLGVFVCRGYKITQCHVPARHPSFPPVRIRLVTTLLLSIYLFVFFSFKVGCIVAHRRVCFV